MVSPAAVGTRGEAGRFPRLLSLLDRRAPLVVQTHDFPDLDAVASAWGLASLFDRLGIEACPCYQGAIRSRSLARLISELDIDLARCPAFGPATQIIVVDGSPSNGNVGLVEGSLLGVIDHHRGDEGPQAPFVDIEPELASCSTLIQEYWRDSGETLPRDLATALLAGIQSDTDFLSRRASDRDFAAYSALFTAGDFDLASRIVRTSLDLRELDLVIKALAGAETRNGTFFAWLPGSCGQEVLAILAEFVLRTEELKVTVVAECGEEGEGLDGVHVSVRSKDAKLSAFSIIKRALDGIGACGGHSHAAGGFIPQAAFPGLEILKERFFASSITT